MPPPAVQYAKVAKLVSNANWEESDIKASIAAISFILTNAAKYNVEGDTLAIELQQLGLPKGARPPAACSPPLDHAHASRPPRPTRPSAPRMQSTAFP